MRMIVDEEIIRKNSAAAQRAALFGSLLLILAVVGSFYRQYILWAYASSLVGLVFVSWGGVNASRWVVDDRADKIMAKALKGLEQGYRFYHYIVPSDHILLAPTGLFVVKVKRMEGQVSCHGRRWRRKLTVRRVFNALSEESLGNPTVQALAEANKTRQWLTHELPDIDVPIEPLIVFVNAKLELEAVEPEVPALTVDELKGYLRTATSGPALPRETWKALSDRLDEQVG